MYSADVSQRFIDVVQQMPFDGKHKGTLFFTKNLLLTLTDRPSTDVSNERLDLV